LVAGTDGVVNAAITSASQADSFRVERTKAGTTVTLNTGAGNDVTLVGGLVQTLDQVQGRVVVNGGGGDTLHLFDRNSIQNSASYVLDATSFTTQTIAVSYSGIKDLVIDGSAGVVNQTRDYAVRGLGATGTTTLNVRGLINRINIGSPAGTLDGFTPDASLLLRRTGRLNVNGPNSINRIVLNDSQNAGTGTSYTLDPNAVTRSVAGRLPVFFSSQVVITHTSAFGSSVEVDMAKGGAAIRDNGPTAFTTVLAGAGIDTLTGPNLATTWGLTALNRGTLPNLEFRGVENLVGGDQNDTFAFADGAGVSGRIDGGAGNNTLNYSRFTTDIAANLVLGQATGAGGGVANISNVTGGQANDVLVGDASDNILVGGPGRNILIGGQGADTLNATSGGLGEDILIGGPTAFDGSAAALALIKAEWVRPDTLTSTYKTRVDHLINGGGLNGTVRLNATTAQADGARDAVSTSARNLLDFLIIDDQDVLSQPLKTGEQVIHV
jgi:hypothetical protein